MSVNVTGYESSLQTQLNNTSGSTSATDMLLLAKAVDALSTGAVVTVATTGDLPAASDNTGRLIYVTGSSAAYLSNGSQWTVLNLTLAGLSVTATSSELNILDGATVTTDELNILDGVTATTAELNTLDGITATVTELNYVDGVTSNVQTQLDGKLDLSGGTLTGALTLSGAPTADLHSATKAYVDNLVTAGISYHDPVRGEVTSNLSATYNNGTAGVGATLTATANGAFSAGGISDWSTTERVLVYNQTDQTQNGIYTVTTVGDGSTAWVLTRATDADSYGGNGTALSYGTTVFVQEGDGAGELYICNTTGTITFGTTNITFAQIASAAIYTAGTGLTLTGTEFSLTSPISGTYDALHPTVSTITTAIDFDNAVNKLAMSANTTFTESNKAEGRSTLFKLDRSASSYTPTFSANIKWAAATEPTWADYRYWVISLVCHDSTNVFGTATGHTI